MVKTLLKFQEEVVAWGSQACWAPGRAAEPRGSWPGSRGSEFCWGWRRAGSNGCCQIWAMAGPPGGWWIFVILPRHSRALTTELTCLIFSKIAVSQHCISNTCCRLWLPDTSEGKALLCQPTENGKDTLTDTAFSALEAATPSDKKKRGMAIFSLPSLFFLFQQAQILGRAEAQNSHHLCPQTQI